MLPAGDGFTLGQWCPVSHTESPGWSWLFTVVYSFLDSLLRVSQSLLNSFLYLGKLHWFPSLRQSYFYEPSVFTFRCVGDRISWKTWCWNENDGGWDVISCLLLSCVLYCMEGEFEQIITKERQQQVTPEWVSLTFIWYFLQILRSYFYPIQTL